MQGILLLNKPGGMSSFAAVAAVRRLTGEKRVGHTGTLDPMASGVLPILIGRATGLADRVVCSRKTYLAEITLGKETDTLDITGKTITQKPVSVTPKEIDAVLKEFIGKIRQVPPMYSAIKKDGVRMYERARRGETCELPPREVEIDSIERIPEESSSKETFRIRVTCSKGTYIRSLCRDIGERLGCGATLSALCRSENAGFTLADCVELDQLTPENIADWIRSEECVLTGYPEVFVSRKQAVLFSTGGGLAVGRLNLPETDGIFRVKYGECCVGLGEILPGGEELKLQCLLRPVQPLPESSRQTALALGTFDGVHKGHEAVLQKVVGSGYPSVTVAFSKPPKAYFSDEPILLTGESEKEEKLKKQGIDSVYFLDFPSVRDQTPEEFFRFLLKKFHPAMICCGYDYTFGKGASGNIQLLSKLFQNKGIELSVIPPVYKNKDKVSSSLIREKLKAGKMEAAAELIGEPYSFTAPVIHGDARGRTIGFPTVNQRYPKEKIPLPHGVYMTRAEIDGKAYVGMTNIGIRPTFESDFVLSETYFLGYSGDLYGRELTLQVCRFLRREVRFSGLSELREALKNDYQTVCRLAESESEPI